MVISPVHGYECMLASLYYFEKISQRTFCQHLPFQSVHGNTKVRCERCSGLIKKTLVRRKLIVVVHLLGLNKLYTLFECFYGRFRKASKCPVWYWQYFNADILTHS